MRSTIAYIAFLAATAAHPQAEYTASFGEPGPAIARRQANGTIGSSTVGSQVAASSGAPVAASSGLANVSSISVPVDSTSSVTIDSSTSIPAASTTTDPTASSSALCNAPKNNDTWDQFGVGDFFVNQASSIQFTQGVQDTFIALSPKLASSDYTCGFDIQCEITGVLEDSCPDNPQAITVLIAFANFSNFFQAVSRTLVNVVSTLTNAAGGMPATFNPTSASTQTIPDNGSVDQAGLFLTALGALAALIPGGEVLGLGATIAGAAVPVFGDQDPDPAVEAAFNSFASITQSLGSAENAIQEGLKAFVVGELDNTPGANYANDPTQLPQLLKGGNFAAPIPNLPDSISQGLTAALAAPAISRLWNQQQIVVAKVSQAELPIDPCEGDNLFSADTKFCDTNGNAFILQGIPADLTTALNLDSSLQFSVPGFSNISDFGLTIETITQASQRIQDSSGLQSAGPSPDDFVSSITGLNPSDVSFSDVVFFNLPVCDMDAAPISDSQMAECQGRFGDNVPTCVFNTKLLCGCPQLKIGDASWPYATDQTVQCVLQ